MNIADYHAHQALGSTGIRALLRSPAHYKALSYKGQTDAQKFGSLVHTLVLEPDSFNERYVVAPGGLDRRRKGDKQIWADFCESAKGRDVIDECDERKARRCAESLMSHKIGATIKGAKVEQTLLWEDHETGVACKARPDVLPSGYLIDVKTAADGSPDGFAKSVARYGYHIQAAHYMEGAKAHGVEVRDFVFAVVETEEPFIASAYVLTEADLEQGREERRQALDIYATCVANGSWPGYAGGDVSEIEMPRWAWSESRKAER